MPKMVTIVRVTWLLSGIKLDDPHLAFDGNFSNKYSIMAYFRRGFVYVGYQK